MAALAGVATVIVMMLGASGPAPRAKNAKHAGVHETPSRPDAPRPSLGLPLARLVPSDALAFVSVADVPGFVERLSETGLARAFADERVAPFAREVVAGLPREAAEIYAIGLVFARGLVPWFRGEAVVALLNVGSREGGAAFDAVFMADVSGRAAEVRAFLGATLALRFIAGRIEAVKIAGVDAIVCRSGEDTVAWCECDGLLAVATSERTLAEVLARRPVFKDAPPGIASLPTYKRGMASAFLEGGEDYRAFVDVERLIGICLGGRAARFSAEYGIEGLRTAALVGRVGASIREAIFLDVRSASVAKSGVAWALGGRRVGLGAAARMPPETIFAAFGGVDGRDLAKRISDPRALRAAPKALRLLLNLLGRGSAQRVLEGVRGEAAVAAWNEGHVGWFPRMAAVAEVLDRPATERTLEAAWRSMAARMRGRFLPRHDLATRDRSTRDPSRDVTVGFIDGPEVFIPLVGSPAYGLDGATLVVGTAATAVSRFMEESGGLAGTEGFRSLLAEFPAERSAFVYVNVETLVERALEPHGPVVLEALVPGLSGRLDREELPPGEAVARYLGPAGVSAMPAGEGVRIDALTPTGLAVALFVMQAVLEAPRPAAPPSQLTKPAGAARPRR